MRRAVRRDWRMAALGGSCFALGTACLLLAACSANLPPRPNSPPAVSLSEPPVAAETPAVSSTPPAQAEWAPVSTTSPWERLRQRFVMPGCDYSPAVRHWAHVYTESRTGFSASLNQAMPFLLVVLDQIEQRNLPGEFAFLPYIESNYTPLASSGDRAAGIWQLMPDTAREAGLRIRPDYDGRLDVHASTTAALDLLQRYQQEFGDWRLANMAFNAGEYRVKSLVGDDQIQRSAAELDRLHLNRGTHNHLAKLLAVACIVSDPQGFDVELPEPDADDTLALLDFPAPVDLGLAARISGLETTQLQRLNPAYRHGRMPADGPFHLLLPATHRLPLEEILAKLPQSSWRNWHEVVLKQPEFLGVLASANAIDAGALAAVNRMTESDEQLAAGTRLLLPGLASGKDGVPRDVALLTEPTSSTTLTIHSGDTLWSIAHRQHIQLDDLLRWNGLARDTTLHLGQRLRLQAPPIATDGAVSTSGAAPAAN